MFFHLHQRKSSMPKSAYSADHFLCICNIYIHIIHKITSEQSTAVFFEFGGLLLLMQPSEKNEIYDADHW